MTRRLCRWIGFAAAGAALLACSKKSAEPAKPLANPKQMVPVVINDEPTAPIGGDGLLDPNDPKHGTRKLLNLDAPVFVDGVQAAVLRWGDLPAMPVEMLEGETPSYRVYDYLEAIGVSPAKVKSVHFHGNQDRIGSIEGSELRAQKERFTFTFSSQTTGTPSQRWDTEGLKNEFVFHEIRKMSVFVKKTPAKIHPTRRCHLDAAGACTDAIPYAETGPAKGTRVYLDGRMIGFVKRRKLADTLVMGETADGAQKLSLTRFVSSLGVDTTGVKAVELVAGDEVVGRASADQWRAHAPNFFFTLPRHNHGKIRVHVPAEMQAADAARTDRDALVSAVVVYKATTPANRELVAISEDTDLSVLLANNELARTESGRGEH